MALDGIPETLPPIVETAERSPYAPSLTRVGVARKRPAPTSAEEDGETLEREPGEGHVLDDLA